MQTIIDNINNSYLTLQNASVGNVKEIAVQLRAIGKKITDSGVKKQYASGSETSRTNWLKAAKQWLFCFWATSPASFELIWTELELFVRDLRRQKTPVLRGAHGLPFPILEEVEKSAIQIKWHLGRIQDICDSKL